MLSALSDFMSENATMNSSALSDNNDTKFDGGISNSRGSNRCGSGTLLIGGCIDWDHATASNPKGLDVFHRISIKDDAISTNLNLSAAGNNKDKKKGIVVVKKRKGSTKTDDDDDGNDDDVVIEKKIIKTYSSSSSLHQFLLMNDYSVYAMGRNDHGQLGCGDLKTSDYPLNIKVHTTIPPQIQSHHPIVINKIATGRSHSLFLFNNGQLYGCGANNYGQLGLGATATAMADSTRLKLITFNTTNNSNNGNGSNNSTAGVIKIIDIACGYDFSIAVDDHGVCYTFGHPEYGQLGHGTDGKFIKAAGKEQFTCVYTPKRIEKYVVKDNHNKLVQEIPYHSIHIRAVAAGKNHAIVLEDWDDLDNENAISMKKPNLNRVFSWGFGGYGRLGHNFGQDEFFPREITHFSHYISNPASINNQRQQVVPVNKQKQIRQIVAGSSFSIAISESKHLYYWGKISNAPRGEANMYPQIQSELYDYPVVSCSAGNNLIVVISSIVTNDTISNNIQNRASTSTRNTTSSSSSSSCSDRSTAPQTCSIAWGVPVAGLIGFDGNSKTSTVPKFITIVDNLDLLHVSCGYGHVSYIVSEGSRDLAAGKEKLLSFPLLLAKTNAVASSATGKGKAKTIKKIGVTSSSKAHGGDDDNVGGKSNGDSKKMKK
jgi:alpha-tubulin suppressor-like RCC1 family protein